MTPLVTYDAAVDAPRLHTAERRNCLVVDYKGGPIADMEVLDAKRHLPSGMLQKAVSRGGS